MSKTRYISSELVLNNAFIKIQFRFKGYYTFLYPQADHVGIVDVIPIVVQTMMGEDEEFDVDEFVEDCNANGETLLIKLNDGQKLFFTKFIEINQKRKSPVTYLNPNDKVQLSILENLESYAETKEWLDSEIRKGKIVIGKNPESPLTARAKLTKQTKDAVLKLDNYTCSYCGSKKNLQVDHVIAITNGGDNEIDNLTTCCKTCNKSKGDKSVLEFIKQNNLSPGVRLLATLQKEYPKDQLFRPNNGSTMGQVRVNDGSKPSQAGGSYDPKVKVEVKGKVEVKEHSTTTHTSTSNKKPISKKTESEPKKLYSEFVYLTDHERQKLIIDNGTEITTKAVEILSNHIGATGQKYKSHYHALLKWAIGAAKEQQKKNSNFKLVTNR